MTRRKSEALQNEEAAENTPDAAPSHDDDDDEFTAGSQSQHINISLTDVTI